jgi:glyoxylase-like metal-dependent hydrolase (beta-lactamase superfamily II)
MPLLAPHSPSAPAPMTPPAELQQITRNLLFWQSYDPQVKADLSSAAIITSDGIFLVDPIPLADSALDQLRQTGSVAGVIITNANHLRASAQFSALFSVPIYTRGTFSDTAALPIAKIEDGTTICHALAVIAIEGAAPGEVALCSTAEAGALILGDALINFEPHGFTFLPRKYCSNQKQMRRSLRKLLAYKFERIFFAHGTPVLSQGRTRLRQLLDSTA